MLKVLQTKTISPKIKLAPSLGDPYRSPLLSLQARDGAFNLGGPMLQSWVERVRGTYVVKTAKVTPYGFINVRKTDRFNNLDEANKKADLCNYIWKKTARVVVAVSLAIFLYGNAYAFTTEASYYTRESCLKESGQCIMANGKELKDDMLIAASWDYAFGTRLLITNIANNRTVEVVVSDRGPAKRLYRQGRKIDLSKLAFSRISELKKGLVLVSVEVLK